MNKTIKKALDILFKDITAFGGFFFYLFLVVFLFALKSTTASYNLFFGLIIAVALTLIIRFFYFKERPSKQNHSNFLERLDASSFPSLHSMRITIICLLLNWYFPSTYILTLTILMFFGVLASRLYLKKHDWKDVLAGVVFGILISVGILYFSFF